MSAHNNLNWSDFLLCIGMELAFHKNGERPEQEQMIAEKNDRNGGMEMTKWWVELGDLYVSSELIERILKEHESDGDEDEGI